ncbi:MAG: DNA polymerase III subunit gamma and tau, partial [Micrococcales bacterium]|nr:DNA polymerase III subunit gamma and tau [Micrococcales bacterium]
MNQALYRRYRPETFAELIGQSQVTAPLMTALKTDRVNHAYLFSGPRGCGKTTSARILARCLNCAEGPTDTPCGKCPSCIELSRDGSGSLDVVEIDAASHNGVDDARDLRERAIFAPARDRYKIFILDEAHMVTPQGFNALLKIVEEPPAHVKFIFATTEPEKVIGTIRSRTHHYPFRLVPPAQMLAYLEEVCKSEIVTPGPGVLTLVVRAGGGSVRDSLSLLDQLIAGSEVKGGKAEIEYDRAAALLGYTHASLLDEVVDAFATQNSSLVFSSVDKVIQSGQDPRRFVEDLLEKLRDLIVVLSVGDDAKAVLRGIADDELEKMKLQAMSFGMSELTHAANAVSAALSEMSGATSPKLQLELMCAKVLVPSSDKTEVGSLARIERLERRVGVAQSAESAPVQAAPIQAAPSKPAAPTAPSTNGVSTQAMVAAWPEILSQVKAESKSAWVVAFTLTVMDLSGDVLTLKFLSHKDLDGFKADSRSTDALRKAIFAVLGLQVKFKPHVEESDGVVIAEAAADAHPPTTAIPVVKAEEPAAPEAKSRNGMVNEEARYGESLLREMLG